MTLTARVMNPYEKPVKTQLRLILPEGLTADAHEKTLSIPANGVGERAWTVAVTGNVASGMQMVTADVTYDGQHLGEKAECYVRTEPRA